MPHTTTPSTDEPSHDLERPRAPRKLVPVAFGVVVAAVVLGFLGWDFYTASVLNRVVGDIRAKNEPTTAEDMAQRVVRVPDEQNFCVPLFEIADRFASLNTPSSESENLPLFGARALYPRLGEAHPPEQLAALKAFLSQHQTDYDAMKQAFDRPSGQFTFDWETTLTEADFTDLNLARTAAKLLLLAAMDATLRGDEAEAIAWFERCARLCDAFDRNLPLLSWMTSNALRALWLESVHRAINTREWSPQSLAMLHKSGVALAARFTLHDALIAERVMARMEHQNRYIRRAPAPPPGAAAPVDPLAGQNPDLFEAKVIGIYTEMVDAAAKAPGRASIEAAREVVYRLGSEPLFFSSTAQALAHTFEMAANDEARRQMLIAAIACEAFRVRRGQWPARLEELTPEFLERTPVDPFDGRPIRLAPIPDGIKLWTVGSDFIDDGGRIHRQPGSKTFKTADLGIELFDPGQRNRPMPPESKKP